MTDNSFENFCKTAAAMGVHWSKEEAWQRYKQVQLNIASDKTNHPDRWDRAEQQADQSSVANQLFWQAMRKK